MFLALNPLLKFAPMGFLIAYLLGALSSLKGQKKNHSKNDFDCIDGRGDFMIQRPTVTEIRLAVEEKKEWRTNQENQYALQRSLVRATWLTFAAVFIYALITLAVWYATNTTAKAAKESADAAIAGIRPWIKITAVELRDGIGPIKTLGFHFPPTGAAMPPMLQVKVSMLNMGHSVAQDVEVNAELFFGKFQSDKWYDVVTTEQQRFCESVSKRAPTGAAKIIFPSESTEFFMGVGGIVQDADMTHLSGNPNPYAAASLILCVNYSGDGSLVHQSQARSSLYEDKQAMIAIGLDVDADRLTLIREPNGDHAK